MYELDHLDYDKVKIAWIEPLIMPQLFRFDNRKLIIKRLFPVISPDNDQKYYRWMWEIKPHWCENCATPLQGYSAVYISHIKTRGAHTELRYDPMNSNILCTECHNKWEYGTLKERRSMYVYWKNILNENMYEKKEDKIFRA